MFFKNTGIGGRLLLVGRFDELGDAGSRGIVKFKLKQ